MVAGKPGRNSPLFGSSKGHEKYALPLPFCSAKEEHALKIRWVKAPLNGRRNVQNNSNAPQGEFLNGGAPNSEVNPLSRG